MKQAHPHIFFMMAKLPLLLLYLSFFTVQLFYNFDIAGHAADTIYASLQKSDAKKKEIASIKKDTAPTEKKLGFRLNKRYQPQAAITCNPLIIKQVVCYVSSKLHVHYCSGFVPSSFPPAHALRGPPVV